MSCIKKLNYSPRPINNENHNTLNVVSFKNLCNNQRSNKSPLPSQKNINKLNVHQSGNHLFFQNQDNKMHQFQQKSFKLLKEVNKSKQKYYEDQNVQSSNTARNDQQLKQIVKSKQKQIASLTSQVRVLQNTIQLLHSQVQTLTKDKKHYMKSNSKGQQNHDVRKQYQNTKRQNQLLKKDNSRLLQQVGQFRQIIPKLNQLQQIQDMLIQENKKYKIKEQSSQLVLKSIQGILAGSPSQINNRICQMINSVLY